MEIHKYSGAGNDFLLVDGRRDDCDGYRRPETVSRLCDRKTGYCAADGRTGADGLMILSRSESHSFSMEFFNPDGSSGMMCGNGGRCIVAFAESLGIPGPYSFEAPDGIHHAEILSRSGRKCTVRLEMKDVDEITDMTAEGSPGVFLNTGARHFVVHVPDLGAVDVATRGRRLRQSVVFAPQGANVDFVRVLGDNSIELRTFEKGVEAETLACGTGIVASALATWHRNPSEGRFNYSVRAREESLTVEFTAAEGRVSNVYLTGPAEEISRG